MSKPKRHAAPYKRTTVALRGTVARIEAQLDFPSQLTIAYARQWLKAGPGQLDLDVLASGVMRRALALYVDRLSDAAIDPAQEAKAVLRCCSTSKPNEDAQQAAWERLQTHRSTHPLPPYVDILAGPHSAAKLAAFNERAEELAELCMREPAMKARAQRQRRSNA